MIARFQTSLFLGINGTRSVGHVRKEQSNRKRLRPLPVRKSVFTRSRHTTLIILRGSFHRYVPHVEITTMNTSQTIEAAWPQLDRLAISSNVNYDRGTGGGVVGVEFSRMVAKDVTADVGSFCR